MSEHRPSSPAELIARTTLHRVADGPTTRLLTDRAAPLSCTATAVALLAVVDALEVITGRNTANVRCRNADRVPIMLRADRSASLIARLLALDTEIAAATELLIDVTGGHGLELTVEPDGLFLAATDQLVDEVRHGLHYLATVDPATGWTGGVPRRFTQDQPTLQVPANLCRRWRTRQEHEARGAAGLLGSWLDLGRLPDHGIVEADWMQRLAVVDDLRPLVGRWLDWLRERGVLATDSDRLLAGPLIDEATTGPVRPAPEWDDPVADMIIGLANQQELIHRILIGRAAREELLAVDSLRPARLIAAEPDLQPVWQQIVDLVRHQAEDSAAPPAVADLGGAAVANDRLRRPLERLNVRMSTLGMAEAGRSAGSQDVVLALGVLHRWAEPGEAVRVASTLLRPGGLLIALENTELTPLEMIIAGLLEGGFTDATGTTVRTPTQSADTWRQLMTAAGLTTETTPVGPTPAVLLQGRRAHDAAIPSPARQRDNRPQPITPGTEREIADLWAELLPTTPRSADDSFFELGGDSLQATRFIAALQKRYGITIAMRELFARPRLVAVAERVDAVISELGDDLEQGAL